METETFNNPDQLKEREEDLKNKGKPFLTLSGKSISAIVELTNKSAKCIDENDEDGLDECIAELTTLYMDMYKIGRLNLEDDMYMALACYTAYNVENIPENKISCDKKIMDYLKQKEENLKMINEYKKCLKDELSED